MCLGTQYLDSIWTDESDQFCVFLRFQRRELVQWEDERDMKGI